MERQQRKKDILLSLRKFDEIAEILAYFLRNVNNMHPFCIDIDCEDAPTSVRIAIFLTSFGTPTIEFLTPYYKRSYIVEHNHCKCVLVMPDKYIDRGLPILEIIANMLENKTLHKIVIERCCDFLKTIINDMMLVPLDDIDIEALAGVY